MRPPSQEFQFLVIVNTTAAASSTTNAGTRNFRHFCCGGAVVCSGAAVCAAAGVEADAIIGKTPECASLPRVFRAITSPRCSHVDLTENRCSSARHPQGGCQHAPICTTC